MSIHIHFIEVPTRSESRALTMHGAQRDYSRWLNCRLFGREDFVAELEAKLERILEPQKGGHKPRNPDPAADAQLAVFCEIALDFDDISQLSIKLAQTQAFPIDAVCIPVATP